MNKEDIIAQGYLEAYLADELNKTDREEVERFIEQDLEVRKSYQDLQKTLEHLSFSYGLPVEEGVKRRLMESPEIMRNASPGNISGDSGTRALKFLVAASVALTVMSVLAAFHFLNKWQSTDARLSELTARNLELAENYHIVNEELNDIRENLAVLVSPEFSRIILNGTENSPKSKVVIYWNPEYEEVYLNSANLAQLPKSQQYQLWALIDGKPVDAGVFDADDGTFQVMKNIASADAFAVTVEKAGGSESPTLETMQVYGEAKT